MGKCSTVPIKKRKTLKHGGYGNAHWTTNERNR